MGFICPLNKWLNNDQMKKIIWILSQLLLIIKMILFLNNIFIYFYKLWKYNKKKKKKIFDLNLTLFIIEIMYLLNYLLFYLLKF